MSEAVAQKKQVRDDEFGIHGDLATPEGNDSFVVLYDSAEERKEQVEPVSPSLDELNETQVISAAEHSQPHHQDPYIEEILSSDDIEPVSAASNMQDDDGPIALTNEELDGILQMGPATEEEFHPDFPVAPENEALTPPPLPEDMEVEGFASPRTDESKPEDMEVEGFASPRTDESKPEDMEVEGFASPRSDEGQRAQGLGVAEPLSAEPAALDDEELPIAISDEDLDEILLEEQGGELPLPPADVKDDEAALAAYEPKAAEQPATEPQKALAEEEPIALSDDELDHILADAEAGHAEPAPELTPPAEDEILTLDEDPELTLIDDTTSPLETATENLQPEERAESTGFFDSDEDEPITLSDEELDGILSTAPEEEAAAPSDEIHLTEDAQQESHVVEDEEPIALSHEELDGILMDASETPEDSLPVADEAPAAADSKGFFDGDEDEPIALSADELDGIAATATPEEEAPAPAEAPADFDSRYADVDEMAETTAAEADAAPSAVEDDEGPIALSADELDGIAADAHEVTPEAPMVGLSPLDGSPAEPSLAEQTEKPATVFEEDLEAATLIHEDDKAAAPAAAPAPDTEELKSVMSYLDNLLGELPDDVIEKFAQSEYFKLYQKIMDKLGL
jgi:pilus assembly protein FimV